MCGIAGFFRAGLTDPEGIVRRMTAALAHRGPDGSGHWYDGNVGVALGHRRLAIVDLSGSGKQPMRSESGRYILVFNGEIYNFVELRRSLEELGHFFRGRSDTEVMLAAFERWGIEKSVAKFVGMFAFAVWDSRDHELVLARDRLGKKPLFYGFVGGGFVFGSELRAIRAFPGWSPQVDRRALALYIRHNYVPTPWSIYSDIKKLPPASIIRISERDGGVSQTSICEYWSAAERQEYGVAHPFIGNLEDATNRIEAVLSDATRMRMIADVPLGAFLSGGIDSTLVVALMQAQATTPVRTFTIGFEEVGYNEATHAKEVAKYLQTDHTELYVRSSDALSVIPKLPSIYDEPFADSSQIPTYLVSELARHHVTVVLSGDGGDEAFCGYNRYTWWQEIRRRTSHLPTWALAGASHAIQCVSAANWDRFLRAVYPLLPSRLRVSAPGDRLHKLASMLTVRQPQALYRRLVSLFPSPERIVLNTVEPATILNEEVRWSGDADFINRMMLLDTITYLPDDILVKVDRASMAVGLEARAPMLDHRVLECAWSLPLEMKLRGREGKVVLKNLLYRYIPRELVDRPKSGFGIPLDQWLRGPLREWADSLLAAERLRSEGYFDAQRIRAIWMEHLGGSRQWHYQIWAILMFQSWLEESKIDRQGVA